MIKSALFVFLFLVVLINPKSILTTEVECPKGTYLVNNDASSLCSNCSQPSWNWTQNQGTWITPSSGYAAASWNDVGADSTSMTVSFWLKINTLKAVTGEISFM